MMESAGIYRNPPWSMGPQVLLAADIGEDIVDWGQLAQGLKELWPLGTGKGILVGVCDTGRSDHSDLVNKIKYSQNFSSSFSDADAQGHSTHVCGTIAAEKNGKGVVGVAYEAELCIAKVLGDDGSGDNRSVAAGIRYCLDKDCDIISMSLGGGYDSAIESAVIDAVNAGKFVICAAGNDGAGNGRDTVNWPGRLSQTVAVASYRRDGNISEFSSRGEEVDIAFPGEDILSCWLGNAYRKLSGTSMATPFCSGVVALLLSSQRALERSGKVLKDPVRNNADLLERLKTVAMDKGPTGHDTAWGWGIVDTKKFLEQHPEDAPADPGLPLVPPVGEATDSPLFGGLLHMIEPVVYAGHKGLFLYLP